MTGAGHGPGRISWSVGMPVLAALTLALPQWLDAQVAPLQPPEWTGVEKVRLWAPSTAPGAMTGWLLEADSMRLGLQHPDRTVFFDWSEIERLDLSFGKNRSRGTFTGILIGAGATYLGSRMLFGAYRKSMGLRRGSEELYVLYVAVPVGALLGGVLGASIGHRTWETVRDIRPAESRPPARWE